jgi:hypothetical protein
MGEDRLTAEELAKLRSLIRVADPLQTMVMEREFNQRANTQAVQRIELGIKIITSISIIVGAVGALWWAFVQAVADKVK